MSYVIGSNKKAFKCEECNKIQETKGNIHEFHKDDWSTPKRVCRLCFFKEILCMTNRDTSINNILCSLQWNMEISTILKGDYLDVKLTYDDSWVTFMIDHNYTDKEIELDKARIKVSDALHELQVSKKVTENRLITPILILITLILSSIFILICNMALST